MSFSMNPPVMPTATTKPETFMLSAEQLENLPVEAKLALEQVDDLKYFLATAPANWQVDQIIRRYLLPTGEYVSCVLWRNLFHVTGTDIVRALAYRFQAFGRPVHNVKKFEEGIFSDLRNLKPGTDASLEEPKSAFLDLLYKNNCIRTQKKQKVFYWFSVPHDRLFLDALERDLKRERMGTESTTIAVQEPALSFVFDATQSLYEQLTKSLQQTAASEVGASLAAQQAHHNLMAQYQGAAGMQYHAGVHGCQPGPSYRGRSQSIQSAIPIDYREHSSDSQKIQAQPVAHGVHGIQLARQARSSQSQIPQDSYLDGTAGYTGYGYATEAEFQLDHDRQRLTSFGGDIDRDASLGDFDLGQAGMSYDMLQPLPREVPLYAPMDSIGSENEFRATLPTYRQPVDDDGFTMPYDVSSSLPNYPPEPFGYNQLPDPGMDFGMPRHFSVSQGNPSYKQRRRRQSIPSSLILSEQAQIARDRYEQRADTEPQVSDRPLSKHISNASRGRSMTNTPQDRTQDHLVQHMNNSSTSSIYDEPLTYKQDCEIAGLERCGSLGTSSYHGSPYSTTSYGCPVTGCSRMFKRLEHMKRHVRTHTHDRPHVCDPCGKSFAHADNLAQHMLLHERGSSSASDYPPEFKNMQYYGQPSHEYSMSQMSYEDMSNYSDVEGSDASYVIPYEERAFSASRSVDERSLSFHDGVGFVLPHNNAEPNIGYSELQIDPISFRDSLNPPSPRTLPMGDVGARIEEGEVTPREPTLRVGSTSETGSCDYVPGPGGDGIVSRSAPRSFGEEHWLDTDMTPRQEQFAVSEQKAEKQEEMKEGVSAAQMWS
ncbi:Sexual development transcription factor SteA [Taphrina deformans PYCC 5710]|uniref:Sexual development transcription factor SteA n=1 Tax=Taphrina deformans (strain PYCC 5710 / ATCC 11124 / CBS 356.35 / IMI 108563 / JCM 9778 / NBRC 8474) TaxID=1097556 RepID=R4X9H1_TAPDE|nr:Sexual development transcription factor SteA [Taphrina deformans PYCC 5710]|eukprot:CCG82396.1 Sexual development transcription factor SteA [Taphrina deformans PYCC 5710]